ncbi:VOC family protein [Paenibacillus piri]|uniref:VOC domain-containing protein n=1 Tax=Paenibacillus piri TaxID=2547395 RepID=A0A4R5KEW0_9BACL|nr:VOC family protein [Paenibacillus piri]TDF92777.1 hypothetical protein E1757_29110 [Paenibacillus piri]
MKIKELTLMTRQLEAMKSFYGSLLGLELLEDRPSYLSFRAGESVLTFQNGSPGENPFYHIAFTIPTNKFVEAKRWVSELGIPLFSKEGQDEFAFENWNATSLYFYDPNGNLIEFIAHHTLDNATNEAFGPKLLLRISEIGLPVDNVPASVRELTSAFQLSLWGGDGQQFAPLGGAEGVLIVVDRRRPWFPDGRTPAVFDSKVTMEAVGSASLRMQDGLYELKSI